MPRATRKSLIEKLQIARTASAPSDSTHLVLENSLQDRLRAAPWVLASYRVYEGEFDDVKTDAGERQVPFDRRGLMKSALIGRCNASKHRQPNDLVFCTRKGKRTGSPLGRRNLLRHIKAAATKLGLSSAVDFRSFRTMHSSLMLSEGARPEVVRDNMGHANIDVTQNVYGKSWWEERVDAVTNSKTL